MKTCEDCKWNGKTGLCRHQTSKCMRHAPVVTPNPNFRNGFDETISLTIWPVAVGPCGDFEPKESKTEDAR